MKLGSQYKNLLSLYALIGTLSFQSVTLGLETKYHPEVLDSIKEIVDEVVTEEGKPVVVFDLDDTLLNARSRTYHILRDMVQNTDVSVRFPNETRIAAKIRLADHGYYLQNTLKKAGIITEAFLKEADTYWLPRFFSNEYCASDIPIPGAAKYVRSLYQKGAIVVYLTGRDAPRMEICTRESLIRSGFPTGTGVHLMMKPKKEDDDLLFKKEAFTKIRGFGEVVAGFENEPANVNAFAEEWPSGQIVFLDTDHSNKPDVPKAQIPWVKNYLR